MTGTDPGDGVQLALRVGVEMALEQMTYHVEAVHTCALKHNLIIMHH